MGWIWKDGQRPTMEQGRGQRAKQRALLRSESPWIFALRVVGLITLAVVAGVFGRYGLVLLAGGFLAHMAWLRFRPASAEAETFG